MKTEIIKSRLDIVKYAFGIAFCLVLILINLVGLGNQIYIYSDSLFNPVLSSTRSIGINTNIFFKELTNKSNVLKENIDLRREVAELEGVKAENESIKRDMKLLEDKFDITNNSLNKKYKVLKTRGIENLYSSAPYILLEVNSENAVTVGQAVYYDKKQLFGFVTEIRGLTAEVVPFYSPAIKFRVPVESSKDTSQKGFVSPIENGQIKIKNVGKTSSISPGDIWTTTNDRAEVPGGFVVGKIRTVFEDKESGFKELEIEPPFDLFNLEYLLIETYE